MEGLFTRFPRDIHSVLKVLSPAGFKMSNKVLRMLQGSGYVGGCPNLRSPTNSQFASVERFIEVAWEVGTISFVLFAKAFLPHANFLSCWGVKHAPSWCFPPSNLAALVDPETHFIQEDK